jgi:hypothetical protein
MFESENSMLYRREIILKIDMIKIILRKNN